MKTRKVLIATLQSIGTGVTITLLFAALFLLPITYLLGTLLAEVWWSFMHGGVE